MLFRNKSRTWRFWNQAHPLLITPHLGQGRLAYRSAHRQFPETARRRNRRDQAQYSVNQVTLVTPVSTQAPTGFVRGVPSQGSHVTSAIQRETQQPCERSEPQTRVLKGRNILAWGKAGGRRPRYSAQKQFPLFFSIRFGAPRLLRAKPDGKKERPASKDFLYGVLRDIGAPADPQADPVEAARTWR